MSGAANDLQELLARVEKATGPDRELDCALACAFDAFVPVLKAWPASVPGNDMTWEIDFARQREDGLELPGHGGDQLVHDYTASLDAALALVERVLPEWQAVYIERTWKGMADRKHSFQARACLVHTVNEYRDARAERQDNNLPLALLAALLRALAQQEAQP